MQYNYIVTSILLWLLSCMAGPEVEPFYRGGCCCLQQYRLHIYSAHRKYTHRSITPCTCVPLFLRQTAFRFVNKSSIVVVGQKSHAYGRSASLAENLCHHHHYKLKLRNSAYSRVIFRMNPGPNRHGLMIDSIVLT